MSNISRFIGNERGDKICHEDDGCPTELAVLKRFWREQQASTLPEEVANLVELLDEEEVPYEDSLGVALSLTGRTKQYANGKTATLREQVEKLTEESVVLRASSRSKLETISSLELQVEKLTKERDDLRSRRCEVCGYLEHEREHTGCLREQLAALAAQNEKFRETLSRWRYQNLSYNWCCGNCGAVDGDEHKEGCALSLPDLASPVLNRIRAEAYREAADIVENIDVYTFVHGGSSYDDGGITLSSAATAIRAKADEYLISALDTRADELEKTNG